MSPYILVGYRYKNWGFNTVKYQLLRKWEISIGDKSKYLP